MPSASGNRSLIPERYNSKSELTFEVPRRHGSGQFPSQVRRESLSRTPKSGFPRANPTEVFSGAVGRRIRASARTTLGPSPDRCPTRVGAPGLARRRCLHRPPRPDPPGPRRGPSPAAERPRPRRYGAHRPARPSGRRPRRDATHPERRGAPCRPDTSGHPRAARPAREHSSRSRRHANKTARDRWLRLAPTPAAGVRGCPEETGGPADPADDAGRGRCRTVVLGRAGDAPHRPGPHDARWLRLAAGRHRAEAAALGPRPTGSVR